MIPNGARMKKIKPFLKRYGNFIFLFVLIIITFSIIATQINFKDFLDTMHKTNLWYIGLCLLCVLIYWLFEAYILLKLMQRDHPDEKFSFAMLITIIGQYYNLVTPGASGGQPLQLFEMNKKDYSIGTGTAVLVQKYAFYQISVTFLALIAIILEHSVVFSSSIATKWLVLTGFLVNLLGVIFVIILAFNQKMAKTIINIIVQFLYFVHIVKKKEAALNKVDKFINEYSIAIQAIKEHKNETKQLMIISIIQIIIFYSINYWIYRALGMTDYSAFYIITMQAILYISMSFVPTPGGAGGAEAGFALIFGPIYGSVNTSVGLIIWRFITFYFIIAFGGIFLSGRELLIGNMKIQKSGSERFKYK